MMTGLVERRAMDLVRVLRVTARGQGDNIRDLAAGISEALAGGNCVFVAGNGGSAADAAHFSAEFLGRYRRDREGLPVVALAEFGVAVSAIANDFGYASVFERQIGALGSKGDIFIGLSTSGASENVLRALIAAKRFGLKTALVTGLQELDSSIDVDWHIWVAGWDTQLIQEGTTHLLHTVCQLVEERLVGADTEERILFPDVAFVDRDGTLIELLPDGKYCVDASDLRPLEGAPKAVRELNRAGIRVVVVTNQQGVAKGVFDAVRLGALHDKMIHEFARFGACIDEVLVCTHLEGACDCRKPGSGLLRMVQCSGFDLGLDTAVVFGDSDADMLAAHEFGCGFERVETNAVDPQYGLLGAVERCIGSRTLRSSAVSE